MHKCLVQILVMHILLILLKPNGNGFYNHLHHHYHPCWLLGATSTSACHANSDRQTWVELFYARLYVMCEHMTKGEIKNLHRGPITLHLYKYWTTLT